MAAAARRVRQRAGVRRLERRSAPDPPHGCGERRAEEGSRPSAAWRRRPPPTSAARGARHSTPRRRPSWGRCAAPSSRCTASSSATRARAPPSRRSSGSRTKLAEPPTEIPQCARAAEAAARGAATKIDGVWRMDTDRERRDSGLLRRELGALDLRVRSRQVRDHPGEREGVHLGLRDLRRRREPHVMDVHGRRRHRSERRHEQARRVLRLRLQRLPRHADGHARSRARSLRSTSGTSRGVGSPTPRRDSTSASAARRPPPRCAASGARRGSTMGLPSTSCTHQHLTGGESG